MTERAGCARHGCGHLPRRHVQGGCLGDRCICPGYLEANDCDGRPVRRVVVPRFEVAYTECRCGGTRTLPIEVAACL